MKELRVGVNGFGRIGRSIYKINNQKKFFNVVAVNDINPDIRNIAYLLQYDSTYGKFSEKVSCADGKLVVNSEPISVYHERSIDNVPWASHNVDVVIDASGVKANLEAIRNGKINVRYCVITNTGDYKIKTFVFGVNEGEFNPDVHKVFSTSICDAIALSPLVKIIAETHEIVSGFLVTLHPWLPYQNLLDGPSVSWSQPGDIFSHYALGRSSPGNIIPKSTSAILAAECVLPGLSNKIHSFSYRVPTNIVSSAVLTFVLDRDIDKSFLINRFQAYERGQKFNIVRNSMEPLTSVDYLGEEYSAIVDHRWTEVLNGRHLKLVYWYDNEWGYANRVVDWVRKISEGQ